MKKDKLVKIILLALVVLTAIAAAIHLATRTQVPEGSILVEWDGQETRVALEKLELTDVRGTVRNGKGEELAVDGKGVLLSKILGTVGTADFAQVTVTADDSYHAVVTAEEIALPDKVFLILQEDGPRLVVFGDENSKRNVSGVAVLTVS